MSVQAMAWAFAQQVEPSARFVLVALANFTDDQGRCWPSIKTVVEMTGLSEATVHRHVRTLVKAGLVTKKTRAGTSNIWTLTFRGLKAIPQGSHHDTPPGITMTPDPSSEPSDEPSGKIVALDKNRARWHTFDELCHRFGIDPLHVPKDKASGIARAANAIEKHTPWIKDIGRQPGQNMPIRVEIQRRARNWPRFFAGRETPTLTLYALAKWWAELDDPAPPPQRDRAATMFERSQDGSSGRTAARPALPSGLAE